ncbi:hypothetical protein [Mycobacterium sp. 1245111.1]|nr:hypothetical protein [Mycobacterium sp. 1245111.1]
MPVRILARTISERTDALAAVGALIERTPMSLREFIRVNRETLGAAR